jgi:hypothetical protein
MAARLLGIVWFVALPALCTAQDLTPRAYIPLPVSSNAVIVTYSFSDGEMVFDPALPIEDAVGTIHLPVVTYYHAFNFFGRSANATGTFPFAIGEMRGRVAEQDRAIHRAGPADSVFRLAVNLWGAPARTAAELAKTGVSRRLLGASVRVAAPTGEYVNTQLINIGTNRWSIKPEIGYMQRVGPVIVDACAGVWLFTSNGDYFATDPAAPANVRTQDPISSFEFHVSYDVKLRLWISADFNYWRGGRTSVNDVTAQGSLQANSRVGVTGSMPLTRRQTLKVSYSDGLVVSVGGKFKTVSVGWQYGWLGMPFKTS